MNNVAVILQQYPFPRIVSIRIKIIMSKEMEIVCSLFIIKSWYTLKLEKITCVKNQKQLLKVQYFYVELSLKSLNELR